MPAEAREKAARPIRFALVSAVRVFRELGDVPVRSLIDSAIYLPSVPSPNAKSGYVRDELLAAGLPQNRLHHLSTKDSRALFRLWRILVRLPWALAMLAYLFSRRCRLDRISLQIILGREGFRRWLRCCPELYPVIISDVSPSLHMLWSAAAKEGNRAIWWQDDFHHHTYLPYHTCASAVLNQPGLNVARDRGIELITKRPTQPPRPMRVIPAAPVIGLATNASFAASEFQRKLLTGLAKVMGVDRFALRLHPTSRLTRSDFEAWPVRVAGVDESMKDYAERLDLAIVGNSAIQLWLLRAGVPVVHVKGLDVQGYDLYGYVEKGFVYGCESLYPLAMSQIRSFYASTADPYEKLCHYTSIRDAGHVRKLDAFSDLVKAKSADAFRSIKR